MDGFIKNARKSALLIVFFLTSSSASRASPKSVVAQASTPIRLGPPWGQRASCPLKRQAGSFVGRGRVLRLASGWKPNLQRRRVYLLLLLYIFRTRADRRTR